jgi:hypothetical protein
MNVWFLLIQSNFQAVGRPSVVKLDPSKTVEDLKLEVKQQFANTLALDIPKLRVWKTKGGTILKLKKGWEETLKSINFNTTEAVLENEKVANLQLSDDQILLVQSTSRIPTTP